LQDNSENETSDPLGYGAPCERSAVVGAQAQRDDDIDIDFRSAI
jgi:hypothetical protein